MIPFRTQALSTSAVRLNTAWLRALLSNAAWMRSLGLLLGLLALSLPARADDLEPQLKALSDRSFSVKQQAVVQLAASEDPRVVGVLRPMLDGQLYVRKADDRLVLVADSDNGYRLTDAFSGEALGESGKRDVSKVAINNSLRESLRAALAGLELAHPEGVVRERSARQLINNPQPDLLPLIERRLAKEDDGDVLDNLRLARAMIQLSDPDAAERLAAVEALNRVLYPEVRGALGRVAESDADPQVKAAAVKALDDIGTLVQLNKVAENVYFGISLGAVLLLAAVGLAITFGVMGVINMAHGEMIMLGAYTTYVIQLMLPNHIEYSLFIAIPAAFLVSGLVGIAIERGVIRHLYGRPLETLLATFGISLILQQAVRSIFSPLNRSVASPEWMAGSFEVNGALSLTWNRLYIIIFAFMVLVALILLLRKTHFGLQMRAVTQNRRMANAMGIRSGWVDALTFGLGSGIAGIAGVALSQLTNVGPNLGQQYIIDSFLVVVFGGVGNLFGTVFGALTLGIANKLAEPFTGAVLAKILVLVFIILFIQKRPRGLFALKGRAIED